MNISRLICVCVGGEPAIFTVSYSGGKRRREKAGQRKSKEFLLIFSFVTERIRYQLNEPIILSI